jgi:hypothetical protein
VEVSAPADEDLSKRCTLVLGVRRRSIEEVNLKYESCMEVNRTASLPAKTEQQYNQVKLSGTSVLGCLFGRTGRKSFL